MQTYNINLPSVFWGTADKGNKDVSSFNRKYHCQINVWAYINILRICENHPDQFGVRCIFNTKFRVDDSSMRFKDETFKGLHIGTGGIYDSKNSLTTAKFTISRLNRKIQHRQWIVNLHNNEEAWCLAGFLRAVSLRASLKNLWQPCHAKELRIGLHVIPRSAQEISECFPRFTCLHILHIIHLCGWHGDHLQYSGTGLTSLHSVSRTTAGRHQIGGSVYIWGSIEQCCSESLHQREKDLRTEETLKRKTYQCIPWLSMQIIKPYLSIRKVCFKSLLTECEETE